MNIQKSSTLLQNSDSRCTPLSRPTADKPLLPEPQPAPVQDLHCPLLDHSGIELSVKREDLLHPEFGGNKWHKLKYNLQQAQKLGHTTLLTFGGAWSNHIHATAAAARYTGFKSIGIIRGEQILPLNPTLNHASECGMQLVFIDRKTYRDKHHPEYINSLHKRFGDFYLIPEGGSNQLALAGCRELVEEIRQPFDVISCACGTGATLAGIITALAPEQQALGFPVLKGADFLNNTIRQYLDEYSCPHTNWHLHTSYHFGGYAKTKPELLAFKQWFEQAFKIPLDYIYTAKMFYGLFDLIKKNDFKPGTRIIAIHTGGLQGNAGFEPS